MEDMIGLLAQYGLAFVFVNVLLTQAGAPVPSTPLLVLAGALIAQGQLGLVQVLLVAMVATLIGNVPWYFAGRRYGYRILRLLCRISIEPDSCVKRTEDIFGRWGALSLVVGKYIPGFATIAPPLAGAIRLGFARFLLYTAIAAVLWAMAPVLAGVIFHAEVEWLLSQLEEMGLGALILAAWVIVLYVVFKAAERYLLIRLLRMTRITAEELRERLKREDPPIVLDVRSAMARQSDARRLPGAVMVDLEAPQAALVSVPPDRDVVVYCT